MTIHAAGPNQQALQPGNSASSNLADADQSDTKALVPAVRRACAIMDLVGSRVAAGISVSDVARELGLAKSSAANLCAELEAEGLLERNEVGLVLGRRTLDWAGGYLASNNEVTSFYRLCRASTIISREAAKLALLDGSDVLFLARHDGSQPINLTAHVGDRFPVTNTAAGKAMMATLPLEVARDRLSTRSFTPMTANSITNLEAYLADLEATRLRGYGFDNEEVTPGVVCFAVAVQDAPGTPARLAVSATILRARLELMDQDAILLELRTIARKLANPLNAAGILG